MKTEKRSARTVTDSKRSGDPKGDQMGEARADLISLALFFADDRGMNSFGPAKDSDFFYCFPGDPKGDQQQMSRP